MAPHVLGPTRAGWVWPESPPPSAQPHPLQPLAAGALLQWTVTAGGSWNRTRLEVLCSSAPGRGCSCRLLFRMEGGHFLSSWDRGGKQIGESLAGGRRGPRSEPCGAQQHRPGTCTLSRLVCDAGHVTSYGVRGSSWTGTAGQPDSASGAQARQEPLLPPSLHARPH